MLQGARRPDWPWFESRMTYANAVLPHALFVAAQCWPDEGFLEVARSLIRLPHRMTTAERSIPTVGRSAAGGIRTGRPRPCTTSNPWRRPRWPRPRSPHTSLLGDEAYLATFRRAHDWFHGQNSLGELPRRSPQRRLLRRSSSSGLNRNQGAESTLAYLWTEIRNAGSRAIVWR